MRKALLSSFYRRGHWSTKGFTACALEHNLFLKSLSPPALPAQGNTWLRSPATPPPQPHPYQLPGLCFQKRGLLLLVSCSSTWISLTSTIVIELLFTSHSLAIIQVLPSSEPRFTSFWRTERRESKPQSTFLGQCTLFVPVSVSPCVPRTQCT